MAIEMVSNLCVFLLDNHSIRRHQSGFKVVKLYKEMEEKAFSKVS